MGPQSNTEQPVLLGLNTDERGNAPAGPVGPDVILAGQGETVDPPGLVGPQNRTEQSVFLGLVADQVGHVPASTVDPDVMMYRNQSVTDGPVGQDKTLRSVDTEGMHAVNDSDRPTAGGPVGRLFKLDPLGPSRMSSLDELNQPLAVGPVGQPFITGPLGNHVRESDCRRTNRINSGPEGSTGVLGPVNQTGSDIQTDRLKIGTVNGPASSGDTPPSSDSGVHSLGEQWENMSTNSMDMESEQNERPSYGGDTRRRVSDTSIPPNTEEGDRSDCPWTDCLLERKSDDISSVVIQRDDREVRFNRLMIYGSEHSMVHSGTDGRNSDIGALSDFSDDDEETEVEHQPGPRTGSDRDYSIEEESNLCDRPVTKTVTAGDGQDSLDPNDMEYWATISRLTRQAFLLDDDSLSDSNYPDVVKNLVRRSRLTIMALEEYDAPPLEQQTGCGTPGCQCDECVEFRVGDSEDMTETDESELEDTAVRDNRSYEINNNYNYSEGMTPRTYTPPLRKKRGRKYASLRKYETDIEDYFSDTSEEESWTDRMQRPMESVTYNDNVDTSTLSDGRDKISQSELTGLTECDVSICDASDDDFFRDEEWPIPEHMVIPRMAADNVDRTVRNRNNNRGRC